MLVRNDSDRFWPDHVAVLVDYIIQQEGNIPITDMGSMVPYPKNYPMPLDNENREHFLPEEIAMWGLTVMYKGIFWLTRDLLGDKKLLTVKVSCDSQGQPLEHVCLSSKSEDSFNHRIEWSKLSLRLTQGKPCNYYPRGRVEIRNDKITVFCHPVLTRPLYRK